MIEELAPWKGNGRMLPGWLDTRCAEAQAGTTRVRSVDRKFLIGLDRRRNVLQLWGPSSLQGGWVCFFDIANDDGTPFLPNQVPWDLVVAAILRGRQGGKDASQRVMEANARLEKARREGEGRRFREAAAYFREAARQEWEGDSRWKAEDVVKGWETRWV